MPPSYGLSDKPKYIPWGGLEERWRKARNYWLGATRPDGRPHAMPVWGLWLKGEFWFSTDPQSVKGRNLASDPRIVVHLESGDDVCLCDGVAVRVAATDVPDQFINAYHDKYEMDFDPSNPNYGVYRVTPHTMLAWTEKDFPSTATRYRLNPPG